MICCGIDQSLAAWLAEQDDYQDVEVPPVLSLIALIAASLALALAATLGHV
jgi:hypothetical protein